jgi:dTDP-4-dehydrorhamnose 3,5-epimerase
METVDFFDPLKFTSEKLEVKGLIESPTIEGVYAKQLKTFLDGRGDLTEIWSTSWPDADKIKSIEHAYFNLTDKGVIKGWHWHEDSYSQYVCVQGKMQIVLIDLRPNSSSFRHVNQFVAGSKNPLYLQIPPYVLKGWKALEENGTIVNLIHTTNVKDNKKIPWDKLANDIWQPIFG